MVFSFLSFVLFFLVSFHSAIYVYLRLISFSSCCCLLPAFLLLIFHSLFSFYPFLSFSHVSVFLLLTLSFFGFFLSFVLSFFSFFAFFRSFFLFFLFFFLLSFFFSPFSTTGIHKWGIKVERERAGCYSAVGVAERNFPLDRVGLGLEETYSWGLALSPGHDKPKSDKRVEVPLILSYGQIVEVTLDMDKGVLSLREDGVHLRAHFEDVALKSREGFVLYPAVNTCHWESYSLIPPDKLPPTSV